MMRHQRGAALPLCLTLLTLLSLFAVAASRLAVSNAQLTGALFHGEEAFRLAQLAIAGSLADIAADPSLLPASGSAVLAPLVSAGGRSSRELHYLGLTGCDELAPLSGQRIDYELRVTAVGTRNALSHQRQRFYMCRETCASVPCTGVEIGPVRSHWYVTRPDLP